MKRAIHCLAQEEIQVFSFISDAKGAFFKNISFIAISENAEKLNDVVHTWFGFLLLNVLNLHMLDTIFSFFHVLFLR